jgi:type IV pilus assembly protein PilW
MSFHFTGRVPSRLRGMSLVELMISMLLGLLVVGSAITVFVSNRQTYRATENLSRLQENGRIAFELMSRDLREAGGNPCERDLPTVNRLTNADTLWWNTWGAPVFGYGPTTAFGDMAFGTAPGVRVTGTDALEIKAAISGGVTVANHATTTATITANTVDHNISTGDVFMVCDFDHAAIAQVTAATPGTSATIVHAAAGVLPGNSTICLASASGTCGSGATNTYSFGCYEGKRLSAGTCAPNSDGTPSPTWPAYIAKLQAWRWFIGNNARGGRSLFRTRLQYDGTAMTTPSEEIAENVSNLQIWYLQSGSTQYVDSASITDWNTVTAARIVLTVESAENIGMDGTRIDRRIEHVVALRNRAT